ncbi:uncharacterized protein LOC115987147 isoform X3 [Quercus lobata]|uniref:uncharacterized protein LOC115987147 isoform X3 n=1 Tax=Quercus lobata TaxID=97700 RepID=UPI0012479942|nr:uncharacterized protein LOC115987147 isoform X3 [Quercus lobata]
MLEGLLKRFLSWLKQYLPLKMRSFKYCHKPISQTPLQRFFVGIEEAQLEGKKGPSSVVDGIEANTFQNILDDSDDEEESGVTTLGESENYS